MARMSGSISPAAGLAEPVAVGDYLTDGVELYCVEEVHEHGLVIEDCRQGTMIEISFDDLLPLEPVRRAAAA